MNINECQISTTDSAVKVQENGRKATFLNAKREVYLKTKHDKCLVDNSLASDWVVSKDQVGDVFIELKGKDVEHGTKQVMETARFWKHNGLTHGRLAGLIVCTQYPRIDTKIQRAKQSFAKLYQGPLHVITKNSEFRLEKVLAFDGPL